jgi:hypothetical protein
MHCHRAGFFPRVAPPVLLMVFVGAAVWPVGSVHAADGVAVTWPPLR